MIPSHANGILRIVKAEIDLPWHGLLAWSTSFVDHADLANLMCTIHAVGTELVATATSLEGSKRELQIAHVLIAKVLPILKISWRLLRWMLKYYWAEKSQNKLTNKKHRPNISPSRLRRAGGQITTQEL